MAGATQRQWAPRMVRKLPHESKKHFLVFAGTGTDLIFNRGIDLPGFASFPLLENAQTRAALAEQMEALVELAGQMNLGCILDTPTWMANTDRAAPLGYDVEKLVDVNRDAVELMQSVRKLAGRDDVLVSACIGPRHDPYSDALYMSVQEARDYHSVQLTVLSETDVDLVTAYTFNRLNEVVGCVQAARDAGLPIVVSLVVETDGRLVDGTTLVDAIEQIDGNTGSAPLYFMVNCAHPSHLAKAICGHPRLKGVIANASKCSHAELDEAKELDEGDPIQLGYEVAQIVKDNPSIRVIGGCCGTDMRHLRSIATKVTARTIER